MNTKSLKQLRLTKAINFVLGAALIFILIACISASVLVTNVNIKYGQPISTNQTKYDFVINRSQYVVGYNSKTNIANWVSWELNNKWLGSAIRSNIFLSDDTLPSTFTKITTNDYVNSGYDRGHMANSQDRTATQQDNNSTFILSNIVPQASDNNRGPWKYLEEYCRTLVINKSDYSLYIVSGPIGIIDTLKGKLSIPKSLYKTVLITYKNKPIKGFAVIIPNINNIVNTNWKQYVTSIRNVETLSNFNFYPNLDKSIVDIVELNKEF